MSDEKTIELQKKIEAAANEIRAGSTWRHYKGGIYSVKGFAINTEDGEVSVRYNRIGGPNYRYETGEHHIEFVRPYREWFEDVEAEPGGFVPRFKRAREVPQWMTEDEIENLRS